MSLCHYVTMSLYHYVTCHYVTMSLCHYVTLSLCHSQCYNKRCRCADSNLNTSEHRMMPRWLSRFCDNRTTWTVGGKIANKGKRVFSSTKRSDLISVPPSLLFIGQRVKRQWRKSDCSAKVKNEWSYTTASTICLRGVDRNVFCFYIYLYMYLSYTCLLY